MQHVEDIIYAKQDGVATISINRPWVLNAFRPRTIDEMLEAFDDAWYDDSIGVVVLTGEQGNFCTGGDQKIRGQGGYHDEEGTPRLQVRNLHRMIREIPKPVIAKVDGYAIGGGHVLHVLCDLTIASDRAIFGQTGPKVGSFDAGFGAMYLARIVGEKKAREIWYGFNADTDHGYGLQALAHGATSLFYTTEEGNEGRQAFLEKRQPDFAKYRRTPW